MQRPSLRRPTLRRQAGLTLIEALVSLGVMAFGILGITGIQATLRTNSDVAKQRAEAVRVAQRLLEDHRGFQLLDPDGANPSFNGIGSASLSAFEGLNATYTRQVTVSDAPVGRMKNVTATVTWTDRLGETQSVVLGSSITGNTPDLSASLGVPAPGGAQRKLQDRHVGVPRSATDLGNGTSKFSPPGGGSAFWVFNNATGVIVRICQSEGDCVDGNALLLSGYIRFATDLVQPTSADAEIPPSPVITNIGVRLSQSGPYNQTVYCYEDPTVVAGAVAYYCAVPISTEEPFWSGRGRVRDNLSIASSDSDYDSDEYRVCRYTRDLAHTAVGSGTPPMTNKDHPRDYVKVDAALTNQNYLIIRAGDDSTAFTCPDDDTSTPFINGRTYKHHPG